MLTKRLKDSDCLALALGGSSFGSALSEFFIPLYMYKITGDPLLMALQLFFAFLGNVAAAQFVIRNRFTRNDRVTCMLMDLIACLAMISATLVSQSILPVYLYVIGFLTSFMETASKGYYESLIGSMSETCEAETRQTIASKTKTSENIGSLAGYLCAGLIIGATNYKVAFLIDAATYALSMFFLARMVSNGVELVAPKKQASSSVMGVLFSPRLRLLSLSHGLAGVALSTFSATSIFILKDHYRSSDSFISIYYVSQFIANVLGASLSYYLTREKDLTESQGWKIRLLYSIPLFAVCLLPHAYWFLLFFAFFSGVHAFSIPMFLSFFQRGAERSQWKVVGASRKTLVSVVGMATSFACGSLLKVTSFQYLYAGSGIFVLLSGFFLYKHSLAVAKSLGESSREQKYSV